MANLLTPASWFSQTCSNVRINKFFETDFTIKINVKKQRRFDRSTVIFELKSKNFLYALKYTINYKNANEILTKTHIYIETIHQNILRHE